MKNSKVPENVDDYIASSPEPARQRLVELREAIRGAAPEAEEVISYHMPYYRQHGLLLGFAAFKDHASLFGAIPVGFARELEPYTKGRGSIQFPYDKPLPSGLIAKLVKARVEVNEARARRRGR